MKNNKLLKFILRFWFVFTILSLFFYIQQVQAVNQNLVIDYSGYPGPLFVESNFYPLKSVEKIVSVTNNSENDETFAFRVSSIIGDMPLADALILQVKNGGAVLLEDNLAHLKSDDESVIDTIPAQSTNQFKFIVYMQNVGNEYQNLKIETADFVVGFSTKGRVAGDKDIKGEVQGAKISLTELGQVGNNLIVVILYSFIAASIIFIFEDKKKRKKLAKVWIDFIRGY